MAGTILYLYDPNQVVWVIDNCNSDLLVREGTVIRVRAEVIQTGESLQYDIQITGQNGTKAFEESDVFPDLPSAMAEYENRLAIM